MHHLTGAKHAGQIVWLSYDKRINKEVDSRTTYAGTKLIAAAAKLKRAPALQYDPADDQEGVNSGLVVELS